MNQREILKHPTPPKLTDDLITLLSELCFYSQKIESSKLLFVFGSNILHEEIGTKLTELLRQYEFDVLLITGGIANYQNSFFENMAESELILKHVPISEFSRVRFIVERSSKNTLENVINANALYDLSHVESVAFFSHSYASMRSYLTLKKYCNARFFFNYQISIPSEKYGVRISENNWYKTKYGRSLVWGEFLRFMSYGVRGDFPIASAQKLLDEIISKIDTFTNMAAFK